MTMRSAAVGLLALAGSMVLADRAAAGWVSIFWDERGHWGYAFNYDDRGSAASAAWNGCMGGRGGLGSGSCQEAFTVEAECVGFVESRAGGYWVGFAHGSDRNRVAEIAFSGCKKGAPAGTCKLELLRCAY